MLMKPERFCKSIRSESFPEVWCMNTCQTNSFQIIEIIVWKIPVTLSSDFLSPKSISVRKKSSGPSFQLHKLSEIQSVQYF